VGGKEILLKAIIQAILVYAMAVFKIPKSICKELIDAMARFWWGYKCNIVCTRWHGGMCP
jgi:hypothetical protein